MSSTPNVGTMKALEIRRNVAKLGLARITAAVSLSTAIRVGPLEYRHVDEPELPGSGWRPCQHPARRASAVRTCR